jgi:hypothetical protein
LGNLYYKKRCKKGMSAPLAFEWDSVRMGVLELLLSVVTQRSTRGWKTAKQKVEGSWIL